MSRRKSPPSHKTSTGVTFRRNEFGMGEYERAGLAGLYLSLTATQAWARQREAWPLPDAVAERLDAVRQYVTNFDAPRFPVANEGDGVRLEWRAGTEIDALKAIVNWAWQVHDGVLFLPGVHRRRQHLDCYYLRLHIHSGLLDTFFQHRRTLKRLNRKQTVERLDEEKTFTVTYRPISENAVLPQTKAVPNQGVCTLKPAKPTRNWIFPGSEPRFNNLSTKPEAGWCHTAALAYLMLFAPLSCHYIKLPHDWAYMVPQVGNLKLFQRRFLRRNTMTASNWPFHSEVAGVEDAALRCVTSGKGGSLFLTVVMGNAAYYDRNQKTRRNLIRQLGGRSDSASIVVRYDLFSRAFPVAKTIKARTSVSAEDSTTKGSHFVSLPSSRERITANLLNGEPWYSELAYVPFWQRDRIADERKRSSRPISQERLWFGKLRYERIQLMSIVGEERMWDDPREKDLLYAFRGAFRRLLNREAQGLGRGGSRDLTKRWENTMDWWHRRLLNAKTKLLLSAAVHELLALASRSPAFRKNKVVEPGGPAFLLPMSDGEGSEEWRARNDAFHAEFRRMVNHPTEWKKVRDLALLALTTFADKRLSQIDDQGASPEPQEDQE